MSANFDRIARPYRWLEYLTLGFALQRCRTHFLPQASGRTHALVLGDGDGRFLAKLFNANPQLRATAVDTSAAMLALLRRRCERAAHSAKLRLRTCNHSALEHAPSADTDLLVAHFFFDCLTQSELDGLIARLAAHIRPDALWLISDFRIPDGTMRLPARALVRALYGAFRLLTGLRVTTLPDHGPPLRAVGLYRIDRHLSLFGLLTTELWRRRGNPPPGTRGKKQAKSDMYFGLHSRGRHPRALNGHRREQFGNEQDGRMNLGKMKLSQLHWLMIGVTLLLFALVAAFVDLKPQVSANFFFSPKDPEYRQTAKIDKIFPSASQLIVNVASPRISSEHYLERLGRLTRELQGVETVTSVESLTEGPKNFEDAEKSPFWKRLLIAEDGKSSNVAVFASDRDPQILMGRMEAIGKKFDEKDFQVQIAGAPYIAETIRRNLTHDFKVFNLTSFLLFGVAMWALFRSWKLMVGMLATCTSAVLVSLLLQSLFGQKIGILTANLSTIIFVVTLSHLVYMTFNWQTLARQENQEDQKPEGLGGKAWRMTLPASFWSMVSASLGFGSLLLVRAKPLRELGLGGTVGTVVALICAYLMYPAFLDWAKPKETRMAGGESKPGFWDGKFVWVAVATVVVSAVLSVGLTKLNTDPSLLDYFKKGRQPRVGIAAVDQHGGSNPLTFVIEAKNGGRLDDKDQYEKMWDLQDALEAHKGIGTVLSLPVLMDEAHRHPFAPLLSWSKLIDILNEPKNKRVASSFISEDRKLAAFYLRMDEHGRTKPRVEVVRELREVVSKHGFKPYLVGDFYDLQGELAKMVGHSLVTGLGWLFLFFAGVALIVARNLRVAAAMLFSLSLVPICMLGGIGLFHIPVDIISAPATNVCIGMAIDSMVHLVFGMKRAQKDGKQGWEAWVIGRKEQWRGIIYSDVIIAAAFAIFALSSFPPTQRFGLIVVAGTLIDILANLFLLPLLGGAEFKRG